jgi:hypothetical protein
VEIETEEVTFPIPVVSFDQEAQMFHDPMQNGLTNALQTFTQAEREGRPLTQEELNRCFGTPAKRARECRRIERSVEAQIRRDQANQGRLRKMSLGTY